jgi:glucose-1-phosphate thymidylyltransferase
MHAIVLAAGYATRLAPLTDNCPKPLLPIRGVPLLDFALAKVFAVKQVTAVTLVSNHKFIAQFENWLRQRQPPAPVRLLDDGSTTNENRLGAIRDLQFAVGQAGIVEDALVLAADNLFAADLSAMVAFADERNADCILVRHLEDIEARRRTGIATLDGSGRVIEFEEKPRDPKTTWAVPPIYVYRRETLAMLGDYLRQGGAPDAPGNFLAWLCKRRPVYGWRCDGDIFDIGNLEQYARVQRTFDETQQAVFGLKPW